MLFSICQCGKHLPSVPPQIISWVNRLSVDVFNSLNLSLLVKNDSQDFATNLNSSQITSFFSPVSNSNEFLNLLNCYSEPAVKPNMPSIIDNFMPLSIAEESSSGSVSSDQYNTPSKSSPSRLQFIERETITEFAQHRLKWAKLVSQCQLEPNLIFKLLSTKLEDFEKSQNLEQPLSPLIII